MIEQIIYYSMLCATTVIINHTSTWTIKDESTLMRAKLRCGDLYEESPCVKTFTKMTDTAYRVICSKGTE